MSNNLNKKPKSLNDLNKVVSEKFPKLFLVPGDGYFYIASADKATGEKIGRLEQSGIYVANVHDLTFNGWIKAISDLFHIDDQSEIEVVLD